MPLKQYLEWFDQGSDRLLDDRWLDIEGYDKTVYSALTVSRDQLRTDDAEAAVLILEVAAFYAPDTSRSESSTTTNNSVCRARSRFARRSVHSPICHSSGSVKPASTSRFTASSRRSTGSTYATQSSSRRLPGQGASGRTNRCTQG